MTYLDPMWVSQNFNVIHHFMKTIDCFISMVVQIIDLTLNGYSHNLSERAPTSVINFNLCDCHHSKFIFIFIYLVLVMHTIHHTNLVFLSSLRNLVGLAQSIPNATEQVDEKFCGRVDKLCHVVNTPSSCVLGKKPLHKIRIKPSST